MALPICSKKKRREMEEKGIFCHYDGGGGGGRVDVFLKTRNPSSPFLMIGFSWFSFGFIAHSVQLFSSSHFPELGELIYWRKDDKRLELRPLEDHYFPPFPDAHSSQQVLGHRVWILTVTFLLNTSKCQVFMRSALGQWLKSSLERRRRWILLLWLELEVVAE